VLSKCTQNVTEHCRNIKSEKMPEETQKRQKLENTSKAEKVSQNKMRPPGWLIF
jgi:hypothetical protein